jgi:rare lipoprotein A
VVAVAVAVLALVLARGVADAAPGVAGMAHLRLSGLASWYGQWHQGRLMANGRPFASECLTAASRTLPIGAWVRVRRGKRSVVVEITDRGPYVAGRILDLSRAAAEALDMIAAGVVMVSIEPLNVRLPVGCHG